MLEPKYIRENIDLVKEAIKKKKSTVNLERWLDLDQQRRVQQQKLDELKHQQKVASQKISQAGKDKQELIRAMSLKKEEVKKLQKELEFIEEEWRKLLMDIPNIVSPEMPVGEDENDNVVIKKWGEIPQFDFDIQDHVELGKKLDLIDIEKASQISGSRFFYLKNEAVLLQMALINFVFQTLTNEKIIQKIIQQEKLKLSSKPFVPMLPPVMIRNEIQRKIHRVFGDQTYQLKEDKINLVASAEHTMAPYHMNETLAEENLPLRYIGYSTAFRREAGTYGKDLGGILRTHQFDKLEMESFTTAETGITEQKLIVALQEYLVQQLEIPYRLVHVCTGDTGKPDYDQFDIECWMPAQNKYRETHTSDYMTDYQMRGIKSFYKTKGGERKLLHTNDATAFAIGRILIAILENNQQKDGSVIIPQVLRPWINNQEKINVRKKNN